ncbi:MAG: beta-lactamase [Chthoniobacteraceae bacterium]|nr:beta-lactamase [Chthoniobacteraceae bacterium]
MNSEGLSERIHKIAADAGIGTIAVAVHDYRDGTSFELDGERWLHAASVIKLAVLMALFKSVEQGAFHLDDPLHVRNRFKSIADGSIYHLEPDRDGDGECHGRIGRTLKIGELARAMIVRSSNLATNLLLDLLGIEQIQQTLASAGIEGVRLVRGVEDLAAFDRGLYNQMTAHGAVELLRLVCEGSFLNAGSREQILSILFAQEFNAMLPAKLPRDVRVAHKTGEISTHSHDAGIVYCTGRAPYVIAIFSESAAASDPRSRAVALISSFIFSRLTA